MIELKVNDIIALEGRIYKIAFRKGIKWKFGFRLLNQEEFFELIINANKNIKELKLNDIIIFEAKIYKVASGLEYTTQKPRFKLSLLNLKETMELIKKMGEIEYENLIEKLEAGKEITK
jgi:hypothetical protein